VNGNVVIKRVVHGPKKREDRPRVPRKNSPARPQKGGPRTRLKGGNGGDAAFERKKWNCWLWLRRDTTVPRRETGPGALEKKTLPCRHKKKKKRGSGCPRQRRRLQKTCRRNKKKPEVAGAKKLRGSVPVAGKKDSVRLGSLRKKGRLRCGRGKEKNQFFGRGMRLLTWERKTRTCSKICGGRTGKGQVRAAGKKDRARRVT